VRRGDESGSGPRRLRPSVARRPPVAASRLLVSYEGESPDHYLVRDLAEDSVIEVPKRFAPPVPFPVTRRPYQRGARLLVLSWWALAGALVGGVFGVALGMLVTILALTRLVGFGARVRRWRRRDAGPEAASWLPAAAAMERQRLRAALGQGLLAALFGAGVLALLLPYLLPLL
jgi:hypothetical protein